MNFTKLMILTAVSIPCITEATVIEISSTSQFNNEVLNSGKPAIVKVGATWCPACVRAKGPFEKISNDPQFADVVFAEVDSDKNPDITQKYNVQSLPTFIYLNKGTVVKSETGYSENLKNDIKAAVSRMKGTGAQEAAPAEKKTEEAAQPEAAAQVKAAEQPEAQAPATAGEESGTCAANPPDNFLERAYNAVADFFKSIADTVRGWFK